MLHSGGGGQRGTCRPVTLKLRRLKRWPASQGDSLSTYPLPASAICCTYKALGGDVTAAWALVKKRSWDSTDALAALAAYIWVGFDKAVWMGHW